MAYDREEALGRLNARPVATWYEDAKFGVFVHWGLFAIPAFAPKVGSISDSLKAEYDRAMAMTPYTEWYANAIRVAGTPSARHHAEHHGGAPYEAFKEPFLAGLKGWDAGAWAQAFKDAGARYVVLVSKHHDGFCLWPSKVANPRRAGWTSGRDLVGELSAAVRAAGLKFGLYYSGGIDWTFSRSPLKTLADLMGPMSGGAYPAYAEAQTRELIERYAPDVLWNDIAWPTSEERLFALFADYYAAVSEGVVNDRWRTAPGRPHPLRTKAARAAFDARMKAAIAANPAAFEGVIPAPVPHSDFRTPEYVRFGDIQTKKWEATRGMSHSFGFNRNDTEADHASAEELIGGFVDAVAKNGNLLLNVGPRADGSIPQAQARRLAAFGAWLAVNGAAVFGSRPWTRAEAQTDAGLPVRFTRTGARLNIVVLGSPRGAALRLSGIALGGEGQTLADGAPAVFTPDGPDTTIRLARPLTGAFAPVIAMKLPA